MTIEQATPVTENVQAVIEANKALAGDATITGTAAFNDELVNGQFAAENPTAALVYGENTIGYIFTPYDAINFKTVKGTVTVNVTDTVAPTGEVKIKDSSWTELLSDITFDGLFFNENVDVTVTAADTLSGVKSVEYIESGETLTLETLQQIANWNTVGADNKISVTAEDAKQFVYYICITDNAGNVTYLSTDGATFDTQPPVIHGITEGATYYTTQKFSVQDDNLENITVNGSQSMTFALGGNADMEYVVAATDKAGNSTTVTVQMKPIASISETIKDLTENNVTGDNADTIKDVEEALAAVDKTDASPAEKDALDEAQANIDKLQQAIEDTAVEVKALEDTLAGYDEDAVKSTDETAVDQLIDDLTEKLKDENLSAGQKFALREALADAQKLADKIDDDKAALEEALQPLPDTDTDNASDADIENLKNEKEKMETLLNDDNYTSQEKAEIQNKLDKIEDAAQDIGETYKIIHGADGEWTDGSSRTLGFTANGLFSLFKEVRVVNAKGNSTTLVRDVDYTAQQGSTVVTLRQSYLDKLSVGKYKLEVVYDVLGTEHIADCSFTVKAKAEKTVKSVDGGMDMITVDGKNLAGFDRLVFEYTISVPYEKTSVTLGGKTSHPAAKADNLWEIPLDVGENVIVIKTTAENEAYNWFYTITVNRAAKVIAPQATEKPVETPQPSETPAPTAEPQPTPTPDAPAADTSAPQQTERALPIIPIIVAVFAVMIILIIVKKKRNDEE